MFVRDHSSGQPEGDFVARLLSSTLAADSRPVLLILDVCQPAASTADSSVNAAPVVAATRWPVTDDATSMFIQAFYRALMHNQGIDDAVRAARIALAGAGPAWLWDLASYARRAHWSAR